MSPIFHGGDIDPGSEYRINISRYMTLGFQEGINIS